MNRIPMLLAVSVLAMSSPAAKAQFRGGFSKTIRLQGVAFTVETPNLPTGNYVLINATGLRQNPGVIKLPVNGILAGTEAADLNQDGSPEIYVYFRDGGGFGSFVGYSVNGRVSLSQITLPEPGRGSGYSGGDRWAIDGRTFIWRFNTANGGVRQINHHLKPGANGWVLQPYLTTDEAPPLVRVRANGDLDVLMANGGTVLYSSNGRLLRKGQKVSAPDLQRASEAVRAHLGRR